MKPGTDCQRFPGKVKYSSLHLGSISYKSGELVFTKENGIWKLELFYDCSKNRAILTLALCASRIKQIVCKDSGFKLTYQTPCGDILTLWHKSFVKNAFRSMQLIISEAKMTKEPVYRMKPGTDCQRFPGKVKYSSYNLGSIPYKSGQLVFTKENGIWKLQLFYDCNKNRAILTLALDASRMKQVVCKESGFQLAYQTPSGDILTLGHKSLVKNAFRSMQLIISEAKMTKEPFCRMKPGTDLQRFPGKVKYSSLHLGSVFYKPGELVFTRENGIWKLELFYDCSNNRAILTLALYASRIKQIVCKESGFQLTYQKPCGDILTLWHKSLVKNAFRSMQLIISEAKMAKEPVYRMKPGTDCQRFPGKVKYSSLQLGTISFKSGELMFTKKNGIWNLDMFFDVSKNRSILNLALYASRINQVVCKESGFKLTYQKPSGDILTLWHKSLVKNAFRSMQLIISEAKMEKAVVPDVKCEFGSAKQQSSPLKAPLWTTTNVGVKEEPRDSTPQSFTSSTQQE